MWAKQSAKVEPMPEPISFEQLITPLFEQFKRLPDHRTGQNNRYALEDAVKGAFAVFFTQSASFLAHQQLMKQSKGRSNAETLFQIEQIPSDNQIRTLLDPISPRQLFGVFDTVYQQLDQAEVLADFQVLNQQLLVSLDGTSYFSSKTIHCQNCLHRTGANDETTYYHTAILPVIVRPGRSQVVCLAPEFIVPQDGHDKQDCERAAAKRWLKFQAGHFEPNRVTLLGDDLYSNQPLCELALEKKFNFIFVCLPESHQVLYQWLDFLAANQDIDQIQVHHWNGRFTEIATYRFINEVPLRGGDKALNVNWCEVIITHSKTGEQLYHNAFVTNHLLTDQTVVEVVQAGRARWKSENENNNVLKTKGYHLEHNFGHGKQYLASFLLTLNLLAFLFHTVLELADDQYRRLRQALGARQTFFNDIRALTRYLCFDSWSHLLAFMIQQLELQPDPDTS
jgi:hypothetical protein